MKINKLILILLLNFVIISSITVTATINIKQDIIIEYQYKFFSNSYEKTAFKILPDVTKYSSVWIDYDNSDIKENKDISDVYYYKDTNQIIQSSQSVDLTGLILQITESTVKGYIQTLAGYGPRVTGTTQCNNAGNYIAAVFNNMDLDVRIQQWSYGGYQGNNIEATLEGENKTSDQVYLVVAHYDSVPGSPGADDNAAGTAAVLASAKVMSKYSFSHTVKFVAFSGEEQGLLGSSVYAAEAKSQGINIKEVLNADMIGYAETEEDRHKIRIYGSGSIAGNSQLINDIYPDLIDLTVLSYGASANSDHWPFIQNGYDAAMYHEYHFNPYYHSSGDTIDKMDLEYDSRVTRMIMATLAKFSNLIISDDGGGGGYYIIRPVVNIEEPSNDDYVRGIIDIKGKATDFRGLVKHVLIQIDNNDWEYTEIEQTQGNYVNWTFGWDTTQVSDGSHIISAVCVNNHGIDSPVCYSTVNVVNEELNTSINAPNKADVNEMVTIHSSTNGGLPPYSYIWDLGDGTIKYEQNINYTYKYPGEYKIELTVKDSTDNMAYASKSISIIDDIAPIIKIAYPENAFYLNNKKIFTLAKPVIIGDIDIKLDVSDNSEIDYVILYINNQEKYRFVNMPYEWTWDDNIFTKATMKVVAFDKSGNKAEDTLEVWKFF